MEKTTKNQESRIMNLKEIEILNKCLEFKSDILDFLVAEARHCEHPSDIYKALVAVDKDVKEADTPSCILIAISKDKIDVAETAENKTEEIPLIKEILSKAERISENYKAVYCVTVKSESITLSKLENRNVSLEDAEKSYSLEEIEDGYRIRQYYGYANHVAIPEMIDGKPVVAIGEMAFAYRKHLALVVIPVTTTIEDAAFYDCDDVEIKVDRVSSENRYRNLEE